MNQDEIIYRNIYDFSEADEKLNEWIEEYGEDEAMEMYRDMTGFYPEERRK